MKSILSSDKFLNNNFELPIGLGKTISNESFVTDLTKMPHLLVAEGRSGEIGRAECHTYIIAFQETSFTA